MKPCFTNFEGCQHGINLVEVMVALVVLSMSLLGLIALQGLGTQYGNKSYYRTQAVVQAYDIIERMRANHTAVSVGDYMQEPIPANYSTDCSHDRCSSRDLANYDLVSWNTHNASLLPQGTGFITRAGDVFTVEINWREGSDSDGPAEIKSLNLSAQL